MSSGHATHRRFVLQRKDQRWCSFSAVATIGFAQSGVCFRSLGLRIFLLHVEHQFKFGSFAGRRIGVRALVVDAQRGEMGHQLDQVEPAVLEAPYDVRSLCKATSSFM